MLAWAEAMRGEGRAAIAALERSAEIRGDRLRSPEAGSATLGVLSEAYLSLGEAERAHALAAEGTEAARREGNISWELSTRLALARSLLASDGPAVRETIEAVLGRVVEFARERGAKSFEPHVHAELAELARQLGDEDGHRRELREAHRLFAEIGATGHTERLAAAVHAVPAT